MYAKTISILLHWQSFTLILAQTDVYSTKQIKSTTKFVRLQSTIDISSTTNDRNTSPSSKRSTSTLTSVTFLTSLKSTNPNQATSQPNDTSSFKIGKAYPKLYLKSWMIWRIWSRLVCHYICINEKISPNSSRAFVLNRSNLILLNRLYCFYTIILQNRILTP